MSNDDPPGERIAAGGWERERAAGRYPDSRLPPPGRFAPSREGRAVAAAFKILAILLYSAALATAAVGLLRGLWWVFVSGLGLFPAALLLHAASVALRALVHLAERADRS